jgi:hypothetical protein
VSKSDIHLVYPFEVEQGTEFEAKITPCIVSGANIVSGEDSVININLKQLYIDIFTLAKDSKIKDLVLTRVGAESEISIKNYDTFEQFRNEILNQNLNGIYMLKADNGLTQIVQKIIILK